MPSPPGTFDPSGFLQLAASLSRKDGATEAELRTAVSRAYYAVFLHARERLAAAGRINPTGRGTDHELVIGALRSLGGSQGDQVDKLRRSRNRADYNLRRTVSSGQARQATALAAAIWPRL